MSAEQLHKFLVHWLALQQSRGGPPNWLGVIHLPDVFKRQMMEIDARPDLQSHTAVEINGERRYDLLRFQGYPVVFIPSRVISLKRREKNQQYEPSGARCLKTPSGSVSS
jgi:hypothetical protein